MARYDYILDEEGENKILNGDFVVDVSDDDNVELILKASKGFIRTSPLVGASIEGMANGPFSIYEKARIKETLTADEYSANLIYKNDQGNIQVDYS